MTDVFFVIVFSYVFLNIILFISYVQLKKVKFCLNLYIGRQNIHYKKLFTISLLFVNRGIKDTVVLDSLLSIHFFTPCHWIFSSLG